MSRAKMTSRRRWGALVALALWTALAMGACGDDGGSPPSTADPDEVREQNLCRELTFDNAVDEALCARVQGEGLGPRFSTPEALCRRLSVDLIGRAPTWSEVQAHCLGKTPEEMVDHFMGRDEYIERAQRRWADAFEYNDGISHYRHILELDALVALLYAEDIDYDEFGQVALTAPGFAGRFFGEARVAQAFRIFLGRDAHPAERSDMVGMWMMWIPIQAYDTDYYFEHIDVVAYPGFCQPPLDELLCHSGLYGDHTVTLPLREPNNQNAAENFIRPEALTEAEWEVLRTPGRVITGLPFYHEHAVAEALDRYLGWPAARALPEVTRALVAHFEDSGLSVRALEREILTSSLYTQRTDPPADEVVDGQAPPWRYSRVKQMEVEVWLDSIMRALQRDFGHCDHRFPYVRNGYHPGEGHQVWAPHEYPVRSGETNEPDMTYAALARALGGCPDRLQLYRFTGTGVIHALDQEAVIQFMCHLPESTGLVPGGAFGEPMKMDDSPEARRALYTHQVRALLSRTPDEQEIEAFIALTDPCLESGQCEPERLPAQLCTTLLQSAAFLHY